MTIANQLAYLHGTKVALRNAMIKKGLDVPFGTPFSAYAALIESLNCGGGAGLDFFGDGSGKAHATFNGTTGEILTPYAGAPTYKATPNGQGLYFSGNDAYTLPSTAELSEYTLSFYMTPEAHSTGNTVVYGNFYYLMLYSGYLMIQQSAINYVDEVNVLGVRKHVTLSMTKYSANIYLDGRLSASASLQSDGVQGGAVYVGGVPSGGAVQFPFIGTLDTLRVIGRTVTAAEALQLSQEAR